MLEKIKRKKTISRQDISKPKTIDELLQKYDFENKDIYDYLDYLVDNLKDIVSTYKNDVVNTYKFVKNVHIENANDWYDTGIIGPDLLNSGVYAIEVLINCNNVSNQWAERLAGVVSWYTGTTNSNNADEIPLSKSGHARNNHDIKLRVIRQPNNVQQNYIKLQISDTIAWSGSGEITIKFRKLL